MTCSVSKNGKENCKIFILKTVKLKVTSTGQKTVNIKLLFPVIVVQIYNTDITCWGTEVSASSHNPSSLGFTDWPKSNQTVSEDEFDILLVSKEQTYRHQSKKLSLSGRITV